jgi:GH15 family glucan-1,4-alpha-glucosidase
MPRDLPVGNGSLLINFDNTGTMRDVYFPHVGQENHTDGRLNRFGVWVANTDGSNPRFAWLDADGWQRSLRYRLDTLVTNVRAQHDGLGITLHIEDVVDFNRNVYIKKVVTENLGTVDLTVRFFFHFDAHLWDNNVGDTGYYDPRSGGLVFYKGLRYFLLNSRVGQQTGLRQWAVGEKEIHGKEGTWRDAEDGMLGGNPVAQGSIDGIGGTELAAPAGKSRVMYWWLAAGESIGVVGDLDNRMRQRDPETYLTRTHDYWQLWLRKEKRTFADLPESAMHCFNRSLLVLRTNIDNGGAIIAASDADILQFGRDTYTYMWPRDGALVATALIRASYPDIARKFFDYIGRLITRDGYLLHKYNPDGSMGSTWHPFVAPDGSPQLPIQEDETALCIAALWEHFRHYREVEFVSPLYRPLVRTAGDFMTRFREPHTHLPAPSYDLWEERHGIMAWTVGAVWAGLRAAANFADAFGQEHVAAGWRRAAQEIHDATVKHMFDPALGRYVRMINVAKDGTITRDPTLDASMIGLILFGMFSVHDPRIVATMEAVQTALAVRTPVGGFARYENDYYHQVSHEVATCPGNPWFICTLWMADYHIAAARTPEELAPAALSIKWVTDRTLESGILAEQVHPFTGAPLSVSPLTWSHAALVVTIQAYVAKWTALTKGIEAQFTAPHAGPSSEATPAPALPMTATATEPLTPIRIVPG